MKTIYKKSFVYLLSVVVIGMVVLGVRALWGEERGLTVCEYGKDFIALFEDIEAGDFIFVRIEQDGFTQFVNNIRYRNSINELKTGKIPLQLVEAIFTKAEEISFWEMQNYYGPVDPNILYECLEEYSRITISSNGKCKRIVFHVSRKELDPLIDLVKQAASSIPESNIYGTFINATDLFDKTIEFGLATYKFTEDLQQQYPELLEAILKPEGFIYINPHRENTIRLLGMGQREFFIRYKNKDFLIRLFERKKP